MKLKPDSFNLILSVVLRSGLYLSILLIIVGMYLFALNLETGDSQLQNYTTFKGISEGLKTLSGVFEGVLQFKSLAIVQLGIVMMIATPVLRVISCLGVFIYQRDYTYIGISLSVLFMLLYSLFYGW